MGEIQVMAWTNLEALHVHSMTIKMERIITGALSMKYNTAI